MLQGSLTKTDVATSIKGLTSLVPKQNPILGVLVYAYFFLLNICSIPIRLIFRQNIGERSISIVTFSFSFALSIVFGILVFDELFQYSPSRPIINLFILVSTIFYLLFLILGIKHFKNAYSRYRNNILSYSYYRGRSVLSRTTGPKEKEEIEEENMVTILMEAGIFIFFGLFFISMFQSYLVLTAYEGKSLFWDTFTFWLYRWGTVLLICGICFLLEELSIRLRKRDAVLDIIDGEYDARYIMLKKTELEKIKQKPNSHYGNSDEFTGAEFVRVRMPSRNLLEEDIIVQEDEISNKDLMISLKNKILKRNQ